MQFPAISRSGGDVSTTCRVEVGLNCARCLGLLSVPATASRRSATSRDRINSPLVKLNKRRRYINGAIDLLSSTDGPADELYDLLGAPEVIIGSLVVVFGALWLAGSILIWDYQERRTDNPEDEGYMITPVSRSAQSMSTKKKEAKKESNKGAASPAGMDMSWINRLNGQLDQLMNEILVTRAVDNIVFEIRYQRLLARKYLGNLIVDSLRATPQYRYIQEVVLAEAIESLPLTPAKIPSPMEDCIRMFVDLEALVQIEGILKVFRMLDEKRNKKSVRWW
eukprot:jgi/Botrbrau1/5867/Bobra.0366s0046.1